MQADDVHALIGALGVGPVEMFASSGGAVTGQMSLEVGRINLRDLIDSVLEAMHGLADRKALYLVATMPDEAQALGDAFRLRQVLTNLVGNAIKFTASGGVTIECSTAGSFWRVSVTDTGIGMSVETKAQLFQKFKQADSSVTRKFGGTGLGLVITRSLVAMHGGEIGVDSTLGLGSAFWFTLPAFMGPRPAVTSRGS